MKAILVVSLLLSVLLLSGCETFHGLTKDLEKASSWVQEKVN